MDIHQLEILHFTFRINDKSLIRLVVNAADIGAQVLEFALNILVAAIYALCVIDGALTFSAECCEQE